MAGIPLIEKALVYGIGSVTLADTIGLANTVIQSEQASGRTLMQNVHGRN